MAWEVEYTDEFEQWWSCLTDDEQESVAVAVTLLEERGPHLGHPHSSAVRGSCYAHMRELRIQYGGRPIRVLYAFDPRRVALLLIGGDKTGDARWYERFVPIADRLHHDHLEQLQADDQQGEHDG